MKKIQPKLDLKYYIILMLPLFIPYFIIMRLGHIIWDFWGIVGTFLILLAFILYGFKIFFNCIDFLIEDYKVSYVNRFFNYTIIDIRYEDIKEINLKCNVLQRICGLGTISMLSNATAKKAGIKFFSIENPLEVYQELQSKIDQCKKTNN
ncbi:MAG TPA: PH domain-containing protein [Rickettsia endosymbiont of Omalisus fontisbellaquei]|nr:PH domain-containing protein [Rickettsia endosymbiont of Omalisus fontisbellaquei]